MEIWLLQWKTLEWFIIIYMSAFGWIVTPFFSYWQVILIKLTQSRLRKGEWLQLALISSGGVFEKTLVIIADICNLKISSY